MSRSVSQQLVVARAPARRRAAPQMSVLIGISHLRADLARDRAGVAGVACRTPPSAYGAVSVAVPEKT